MGLCNSPDIFEEKMNKLSNGQDYVRTYNDDLLITSNKSLQDHIKKRDKALNKLKSAGFKLNVEKSFFTRNELEYLDFKITRQGIMPLPDKVEAIKNIAAPTNKRSFIGLINCYSDMWQHRSGILTSYDFETSQMELEQRMSEGICHRPV